MGNWVVERRVDRLVEGRVVVLEPGDDVRAYCDEFRRLIRTSPGDVLVCADYRRVAIFPPAVADELKRLMIDMNPRVERSAILVAPAHATNALQVERVVREAQLASRRRFEDKDALLAWMREVATPAENARLEAFLAEG
jgi:hypothetical protein